MSDLHLKIKDIRDMFVDKLNNKDYVILSNDIKTLELVGVSFIADENYIFGEVNQKYVFCEISWYMSQSLNVNDIPGGTPAIWKKCATPEGFINSNYGWMIFSEENGSQYDNVLKELKRDPSSRRAVMIYTRPSMHTDQNKGGMQDFCCTWGVQYFIRNDRLTCHVNMRSNDVIFGYRNDLAFQQYVLHKLANDLNVETGSITWSAGSLHLYERHFYYLDHYRGSGETSISKSDYDKIYSGKEHAF